MSGSTVLEEHERVVEKSNIQTERRKDNTVPDRQYRFYRSSKVFESSNNEVPAVALEVQAEQPQANEQTVSIAPKSHRFESSVDLTQVVVSFQQFVFIHNKKQK